MEIQTIYPAACTGGPQNGVGIIVAEEKIDGHRGLLHIGTELDRGYVTSRRDSVKTGLPCENGLNVPHIIEGMQSAIKRLGWSYTVLDGEIVVPGHPFEAVQTVMGSLPDAAIFWQQHNEKAVFMVFDVLFLDGEDLRQTPYNERKQLLKAVVDGIMRDTSYLRYVQEEYGEDHTAWFNSVVANGGEGLVLKDPNAVYGKGWTKWKKVETYDVVLIGLTPGNKKFRDMFGALEFGILEHVMQDGVRWKKVGQCSGMPDGDCSWVGDDGNIVAPNSDGCKLVPLDGVDQKEGTRAWFHLNRDQLVGTVIEVKCNGLTKHGKLRHPQFIRLRPDKTVDQCTALTK